MQKKVNKPCADCGEIMWQVHPSKMYCPKCKSARNKECIKLYYQNHSVEKPKINPAERKEKNVFDKWQEMQKPCEGCIYQEIIEASEKQNYYCCAYAIIERKLRPCPPGDQCTVKKTKIEGSKKADGNVWNGSIKRKEKDYAYGKKQNSK